MEIEAQQMVDKFYENHPDRKIIFLVKAGSHFFNLAGPQSDKDYRGIYLPSPEEFYKGEGRRKMIDYSTNDGTKKGLKNTNTDVDFTLFSVTKFLELLKSGDFNMMELLHAPDDVILVNSPLMENLTELRPNLLVNDISAFLGFIKKEYKRYGINIHHYEEQEKLMKFLLDFPPHTRMNTIWKELEVYAKGNSFISFTTSKTGNNKSVASFKVAQRLYQNTVRVDYITDAIKQRLTTYGHRQKNMASAGVEFKGLYHALRLIYEANDLFDYGEFKLPFNEYRHNTLKEIKFSTMKQQTIFDLIDNGIEYLYDREKEAVSNKKQVGHFIDKLLFKINGTYKVKHLLGGKHV